MAEDNKNKYISEDTLKALKEWFVSGNFQKKILRQDFYLTSKQAAQLGYEAPEGADVILRAKEAGVEPVFEVETPEGVQALQRKPPEIDYGYREQDLDLAYQPELAEAPEAYQQPVYTPAAPDYTEIDRLFRNLYPELGQPAKPPVKGEYVSPVPVAGGSQAIIDWAMSSEENLIGLLTDIQRAGWSMESEQLVNLLFPDAGADAMQTIFPDRLYVPEEQVENVKSSMMRSLAAAKPETVDFMFDYLLKNPKQLRETLVYAGRNAERENLVRLLYPNMTDYDINNYFSLDALAVEMKAAEGGKGVSGTFTAGVGDLVANIGGIFRWAGKDGVGEKLTKFGQYMQVQAEPIPAELQTFHWKQLFNPKFWTTHGVRQLPTIMTLAMPAFGAYGLAGKVTTNAFAKAAIAGLGGTAVSRPFESGLEAASAYDMARQQGLSHEEAEKAAWKVFQGNMALAGTDVVQIAAAFMPVPFTGVAGSTLLKVAKVGGKVFFTGLTEGGEEVFQELIQLQAMGDKRSLMEKLKDPEMQLVFSLGAAAGIGMGAGGDIVVRVQDYVVSRLNPEQAERFNELRQEAKDEKLADDISDNKALTQLIEEEPELESVVKEAVESVETEIAFENLKPRDETERVAFEYLRQQRIEKPAKAHRIDMIMSEIEAVRAEAERGNITTEDANRKIDALKSEIKTLQQPVETIVKKTEELPAVEEVAKPEVKPERRIPEAEAGEPEAGLQPAMIEGVKEKVVRPKGKGKLVQARLEDYLELEKYKAGQEAEGIKAYLETTPLAQERFKIGGKNVGIDSFISIREQSFPEYFSIKQAQALFPNHEFTNLTPEGRVPRDAALDDLTKRLNMTPDEIADMAMEIRKAKTKLKEVGKGKTITPTKPLPEPSTEQMAELETGLNPARYTLEQIDALVGFFGDYINNPSTQSAWELTQELRRETRAKRAEDMKARTQQLIAEENLSFEEAVNKAMRDTMNGEIPSATTDYLDDMTEDLRDALFGKIYYSLKEEPYEMMSTFTALTNALAGKPIPREPGVTGRSAYTRLQRVFGEQVKALDKASKEGDNLADVVEGMFHEVGREPIPVDKRTADYLRVVGNKIKSSEELNIIKEFEKKHPMPDYEPPIKDAITQSNLWDNPSNDKLIRVLKELAWLPVDIGNFLRANKASVDFSFWRQQAPLIFAHKVDFANSNIDALTGMFSQKSAEAQWNSIVYDKTGLYQIYETCANQGGDFLRPLDIPKGTERFRGVEEFGYPTTERLIPRLTMKLPWIKLSQRGFSSGTNSHNWRIFRAYYFNMLKLSEQIASGKKKLKEGEMFSIEKEMVDFSKMLANFTARGSLGKLQVIAPEVSGLLFAPRATLGRILSIKDLVNANPRVRREAWKNMLSFVSTFSMLIFAGNLLGLWEVEKDPRNAEFMSIRIGNTRIDPWGGYRQLLTFAARITTGTGISSVTGAEYDVNPIDAVVNFARGKASPLAGMIIDFWTGRNFVGEEVDISNPKQWADRISPFAVMDIYEAYMDDPMRGIMVTIPSLVGFGVQTYTGDWSDNFAKLGTPKYEENLVYGIQEPFYDTEDFWADTARDFKGVDPESLTIEKGYPGYIRYIAEAYNVIMPELNILQNKKLVNINADPTKDEPTYQQYYQMWRDRQKLVASGDEEALEEFDKNERTSNAYMGNMTQRQYALLVEYHSSTPERQKEMLKIFPSLNENKRVAYLKSHPVENAKLAIWGKADIYTREAYDEFKKLTVELDIPDKAIPIDTLPPEESIDTHFAYLDSVANTSANSWETQLIKAKDTAYCDWSGLDIPDSPIEAIKLKIKHRDLYDIYEGYGNTESALYIEDDEQRKKAREKLKEDNPDWRDDIRRIDAIENDGVDYKELWVECGNIMNDYGINSSEKKVWLIDNPEVHQWALEHDLITDDGSDWNEPSLRIDVKWRDNDIEYNDLPSDGNDREIYLRDNPEYRKDRRRRVFYGLKDKEGLPADVKYIENYVDYYELFVSKPKDYKLIYGTDLWYEDDWYMMEHRDFYKSIWLGALGNEKMDFRDIPTREVFAKYLEYIELPQGLKRFDYRSENPDLDEWLVSKFGYTSVSEQKRRSELTPTERVLEGLAETEEELRKQLEESGSLVK